MSRGLMVTFVDESPQPSVDLCAHSPSSGTGYLTCVRRSRSRQSTPLTTIVMRASTVVALVSLAYVPALVVAARPPPIGYQRISPYRVAAPPPLMASRPPARKPPARGGLPSAPPSKGYYSDPPPPYSELPPYSARSLLVRALLDELD
ncbi:uncharacterized protein FIBRA_01937 [Fibroporia radiculosa]|uniref:Uncharacterized protein n=1 Tax=Fibroporia radiculosa TaxID=599839 RepID=J4HU48_9APHY|nr:uncharacterized protein FIBRA_01937 [Fibroporia radiculosa]CCL99912.1 predicted protein [Fibroporia radiculosa]